MRPHFTEGTIILKGVNPGSGYPYYYLKAHRNRNGARFNMNDRHILDKLGIEYESDRAYYVWHVGCSKSKYDEIEIDPAVSRILCGDMSNQESVHLLSTENPF